MMSSRLLRRVRIRTPPALIRNITTASASTCSRSLAVPTTSSDKDNLLLGKWSSSSTSGRLFGLVDMKGRSFSTETDGRSSSTSRGGRRPLDARIRIRRSVHFVPGDSEKFLAKCLTLGADTLILDLEDSVIDKAKGRSAVARFLSGGRSATSSNVGGTPEIFVRINPLDGPHWQDDVATAVKGGADGLMVPKVGCAADVKKLEQFLAQEETDHSLSYKLLLLPIATETPEAVLNLKEIATASPERICGITWGCEDLSAVLGSAGTRDPETKAYLPVFQQARALTLLAAKAAGVQAIDGVYTDIRDAKGFAKEATEAVYMGFDGKLSLHPTQIVQLGKLFSPTPEQMREAANIVRIFDDQDNKAGAAVYKGQMIDLPHYTRAKKIIARGEAAGIEAAADEKVGKAEEVFPRVHHGKYLEDLTPGLRVRHALTRTVTEADNVLFTCLSLNPAPIHLDHELCKNTEFGKPLFNSMFTLALLVGMSVLETTHGTTIANLGFSGVKFPYPVYPGDTLRAETLIVDARESASRPTQGIVTLEHSMFNQEGKLVCVCTRQALMKKKPVAKM